MHYFFFRDLNADQGKDPERVVASWDVLMFTTAERQNELGPIKGPASVSGYWSLWLP